MKNEKKMAILDRLVKDGSIDLAEALVLLETENNYATQFDDLGVSTFSVYEKISTPQPNPYLVTCTDSPLSKGMYGTIPNPIITNAQ